MLRLGFQLTKEGGKEEKEREEKNKEQREEW
jgi:hypothetical protein